MPRRALLAERRAFGWLDLAAQHIAGVAQRRLLGMNPGNLEALLRIEFAIILRSAPSRFLESPRSRAKLGPLLQIPRPAVAARSIPVVGHNALVGVFHSRSPRSS